MKNLVSLIAFTVILSCSTTKENDQPQLPAATQTGANTAGCLVNGQVFLPKGSSQFGLILSCFYQQIQNGFHLGLSIVEKTTAQNTLVNISLNPTQLAENITYNLTAIVNGTSNYASNFGELIISNNYTSDLRFNTTIINVGELKITKLNTQQKIISGTFWYDAIKPQGEIVKIREGRFDMRYVN